MLTGACAEPGDPGKPAASPTRDPAQVYEATLMVLSSPGHGPEICAGVIRTSLPPQCGGFAVEPWDWAAVDGEESRSGTSWGDFHLVGAFDGTTFHLTEPPGPPHRFSASPTPNRFASPCAEPAAGGDPAKTSDDDKRAAITHARVQDDFAAVWVADSETVVVLGFTGDLERHEREARERWGGGLCVIELPRTRAFLERAQTTVTRAHDEAAAAGFYFLSSDIDEREGVVEVDVLIADDVAQAWVDEKIGPGLARLNGTLRPRATPTG